MMGLPRYAIVAIDARGGFSAKGEIPWNIPEDFKHFAQLTKGAICVMGKDTYLDIHSRGLGKEGDQVLPGRQCFVVSTTLTQADVPNATVIKSLDDLMVGHISPEDYDNQRPLFFIGGQQIFNRAIADLADTIYVTVVNNDFECDRYIDTITLNELFGVTAVTRGESPTKDQPYDVAYTTFKRYKRAR